MTAPSEPRNLRLCDVCGGLDTAPRHVQALAPGDTGGVPSDAFIDALPDGVPAKALVEVLDPNTYVRHMDCCASAGCDVCIAVTAAANGVKDDALVAFIVGGGADNLSDSQPTEA